MNSIGLWLPSGTYTSNEFLELTKGFYRVILGGVIYITDDNPIKVYYELFGSGIYYSQFLNEDNSGNFFKDKSKKKIHKQPFWTKDWRK